MNELFVRIEDEEEKPYTNMKHRVGTSNLFYIRRFEKLLIYENGKMIYESFTEPINKLIKSNNPEMQELGRLMLEEEMKNKADGNQKCDG